MNFVPRSGVLSLSCYKLFIPKKLVLRRISIFRKVKEKPVFLDKTNHKVIYNFKYIVLPAGIAKAKYRLPLLCVPLVSVCFYLNETGMGILLLTGSFLQSLIMLVVSRLTENMIGRIYVNKEDKIIKNVILSSIDSKGNRRDESFSPDQLFLYQSPLSQFLGFLYVETRCPDKIYKINVKSAHFEDMKVFKSIFGNSQHMNGRDNKKK